MWDGAISVGAIHPLRMFVTELDRLKAQEAMDERALAAKYLGQDFGMKDLAGTRLPSRLLSYFFYAGLEHHFVMRSEAPHARQYYVRPQLAFLRQGFAVHDWSKPIESRRYQEGLDVVNAPYAFVGNAEEAAKVGVRLGVADTALERSFAKPGTDFNTVPLMAAAESQKIPVLTVRPGESSAIDALPIPPAIREVLRDELVQGQTLLLPAGLVSLNGVRTFGWWSLDPTGGVALGKMDLGAGQGLTESVKLRNAVNELTHIIAKFYGGLIGCYMMEIADQLSPPDGPYEVLKLPGLPTISGGKPLGECVAGKVCEAIVELTILAISAAEYGHYDMEEEAKEIIEELVEMVAKIWLAEEGGIIGCSGLEGEGHGEGGH